MDIKQKILDTIEEKQITPIPAWKFLFRTYGLWILSGFLLVLGSFGVASMVFLFTKNDWDIYNELNESKITHLFSTLPYLWIAIFLLMLVLLYIDIRHTKRGYKYTSLPLVFAALGTSILLGLGLHFIGVGQKIDTLITKTHPGQAHIFNPRLKALSHPEKGILTGRVIIIEATSSSTTRVYVENPLLEGRWIVIVEPTTILPPTGIHLQDRIRALGKETEDVETEEHEFLAHVILPFNTMGLDPGWKKRERQLLPIPLHGEEYED
ncbi:MAG: hypothetical protein CO030_01010 [Candidatus Magasanikbacteria bacterium CG_4_9_14_0_2_um_filter_42_11]|uniref:Uncharacterized protein n=1 Tax=Candidatus Magasanikbacteria bacterium CG_4_9_14_0_2_um_filter_42_11 TaxID=1974643 RepID=A0A2M8FAN5_9BACT|nr:MAG: hypothetical protein COU34_00040 [Candidatus Magasanikbacteria bacterium CG10_big_fil_rev_8_21_14_0_10_43_9]PIY92079.1 MAG: hypothetical protein COY70_05130 [Candidatus Magasanikbacteria bacterium CG_4_10_14_0_8_um_filter_42_12]PJC52795.1 MAG: hypothetical protein CO030_01010 [Candidatus Magasanikbacteria bacterium CG_4_9_14_0_2_um_filter_42_11]